MEPLPETVKKIHVPTAEEIVSKVLRRYKRIHSAKGRFYEVEMRRVEQAYNIISSKLSFIAKLPHPRRMHPFYAEIAGLASNGRYTSCVIRLRHIPGILRRIYEKYRYRILASTSPSEASKLRREAIGRMLSVIRREKCLLVVKETIIALSRTPGIVVEEPKVIIAGPPSSGKSTLLARVSRARPEVAPYPFTTKNVLVGHVELEGKRYQLIDTPGLLDRPLEERNEIELKAILAIRYLADSLIFLVDPSEEAYYTIEEQAGLLEKTVLEIIDAGRVVIGINKADVAPPNRIEEARRIMSSRGFTRIHVVSAAMGTGVESLLTEACRLAAENLGDARL